MHLRDPPEHFPLRAPPTRGRALLRSQAPIQPRPKRQRANCSGNSRPNGRRGTRLGRLLRKPGPSTPRSLTGTPRSFAQICTTNAIESLNARCRCAGRAKGYFRMMPPAEMPLPRDPSLHAWAHKVEAGIERVRVRIRGKSRLTTSQARPTISLTCPPHTKAAQPVIEILTEGQRLSVVPGTALESALFPRAEELLAHPFVAI
jgi:hypothetical protein